MIVIYSSKPSISKIACPYLSAKYPFQKIVFIHSLYFMNISFDYPKHTKWNQFPYIQSPQYKINTIDKWSALTPVNKELTSIDISMQDINQCDSIIYLAEPDYSDAYAFSVFIEHLLNKSVDDTYIDSAFLFSLAPKDIKHTIDNMTNFYDTYRNLINYGKVLKYFDYNYNFNSFALLGRIYRNSHSEFNKKNLNTDIFISKYMLQLLYFINIHNEIYTESQLMEVMHHWTGTGKYDFSVNFASSASRYSIIQNLINLNLLTFKENTKHLSISNQGKFFINQLPKDCLDFDLPFRLQLWANLPFDDVKRKIDVYLHNYFNKVKNKIKLISC